MGERKLKGLEGEHLQRYVTIKRAKLVSVLVPEKLFLVYPKALAGRLEVSTQLRKDVEVLKPKVYGGENRL
jgi:hypothetical protein